MSPPSEHTTGQETAVACAIGDVDELWADLRQHVEQGRWQLACETVIDLGRAVARLADAIFAHRKALPPDERTP